MIDCNDAPFNKSWKLLDIIKSKSNKLVYGIMKIDKEMLIPRNYMIVSMGIFNILEHHYSFKRPVNPLKKIESLTLVGTILGMDCYVDLYTSSDEVLLYYNKQIARDLKLKSILDEVVFDEVVKIEVII